MSKRLSTGDKEYLSVLSLRNKKNIRNPSRHWQRTWEINLGLQPHQKWSPWMGDCWGRKDWRMQNDTKICGNRFYGGMNPPQSIVSPDLNIAVWDHLDREQNKRQPTSKEELWDVLQEAWRTIPEEYLKKWQKACLRGFRLCWSIKWPYVMFSFQAC